MPPRRKQASLSSIDQGGGKPFHDQFAYVAHGGERQDRLVAIEDLERLR